MLNSIAKPSSNDYVLMLLTAMLWASAFVAIKIAVPHTGAIWLAAWRVIFSLIVLFPFAIYRGLVLPTTLSVWLVIAVTSLFAVVLPFFLISWAEQEIDAGIASLLMGTGPFLSLIGSHFSTSDDRISPPKVLAVFLGFCGVLTIVGPDAISGLGGSAFTAQLAVVAGSASYVTSGLIVRKINLPAHAIVFWVSACGAVILLAVAALIDGKPELSLSPTIWFALLFLGIAPTGIANIIRFYLIKKVGLTSFSLSVNLVPVFGLLFAALLLGEHITIRTALALVLILSGLFVSRMKFGAKGS